MPEVSGHRLRDVSRQRSLIGLVGQIRSLGLIAPETYLDQRFLDFLAVNGEEVKKIHWRNFERLGPSSLSDLAT